MTTPDEGYTPEKLMAAADTVDGLSGFEIPILLSDEIRLAAKLWDAEHERAEEYSRELNALYGHHGAMEVAMIAERDEARRYTLALLRLERAQYAHDVLGEDPGLDEIAEAWDALPPELRRAIEE